MLGALSVLVAVIVIVTTVGRWVQAWVSAHRLRTGRGVTVVIRRVRVEKRMRSRGYLEVIEAAGSSYWPVYFHTGLLAITPRASARMSTMGGMAAFDIDAGIVAVPAGRGRRTRPAGTVLDAPRLNETDLAARSERFGSVRRRVLLDAPPAVGAPVVGLLWVLAGGGGVVVFAATTLLAGVAAVWFSAISGSDPS